MTTEADIVYELDELHGLGLALMVKYPQFQDLEINEVTYTQALRDIGNMKDMPTDLRIKLGTEAIQFLRTLFEKMLKDRKYNNIWSDLKPLYVLCYNLLVFEHD